MEGNYVTWHVITLMGLFVDIWECVWIGELKSHWGTSKTSLKHVICMLIRCIICIRTEMQNGAGDTFSPFFLMPVIHNKACPWLPATPWHTSVEPRGSKKHGGYKCKERQSLRVKKIHLTITLFSEWMYHCIQYKDETMMLRKTWTLAR